MLLAGEFHKNGQNKTTKKIVNKTTYIKNLILLLKKLFLSKDFKKKKKNIIIGEIIPITFASITKADVIEKNNEVLKFGFNIKFNAEYMFKINKDKKNISLLL